MQLGELSDQELEVLRGNAERLSRAGNELQQNAAAALLPDIAKEVSRRAARPQTQPLKAPAGKRVAKRAAPITDDAEESPAVRRPPLAKRLPKMTDERLLSLQRAATRISRDPEHSKHGSAITALPMIDAEIGRRTASLAGAGKAPNSGRQKISDG